MAQNAIDLCLASDVESDLGASSGDSKVQKCITAASRRIARYCNRTFERATGLVEYPPARNRPSLGVRRPPIVSIASVVEFGNTVDSTQYESIGDDIDAGLIRRKRAFGEWGDTGRYRIEFVTPIRGSDGGESGVDGYTVTYTGGFVTPGQNALDAGTYPTVTLPEDVQLATRLYASTIYRTLGLDLRVAAESIGDWSATYFGAKSATGGTDMPETVVELISPYQLPPGWP